MSLPFRRISVENHNRKYTDPRSCHFAEVSFPGTGFLVFLNACVSVTGVVVPVAYRAIKPPATSAENSQEELETAKKVRDFPSPCDMDLATELERIQLLKTGGNCSHGPTFDPMKSPNFTRSCAGKGLASEGRDLGERRVGHGLASDRGGAG